MSFTPDPREIVAGNTLIAQAIQSQNFAAGSAGWQIAASGSAEFNNVTIRGSLYVVGSGGSQIQIVNSGGQATEFLYPADYTDPTVTNNPAAISAASVGNAGTENANLLIRSPYPSKFPASANYASLQLRSSSLDGVANASSITVTADTMDVSGHVTVAGTDIGAGIQAGASSTSNSASNATTTAAAVLTISSFVFKAGRAYSVKMGGGTSSNVSGTGADFRVFKSVGGVLGVEFGEFYRIPCSLGGSVVAAFGEVFVKNNTGADITTDVALTLASTTAGNQVTHNAGANRERYFKIADVGLASASAFNTATVVS